MTHQCRLHYCPADGWFGDAIPFCWNGVYHIFYMKAMCDGSGAPWGHIASTDLLHWQEYPDPIRPGAPGSVDGNACQTGSIIAHDGLFHMFYTGVGAQWQQTVCHATSRDLITWEKDPANPILLPDTRWYDAEDWRDPQVIANPEGDGYWMLIGTRERRDDSAIFPYRGCVALATSPDLTHWKIEPPVAASGVAYMDCPDIFRLGERWALLIALRETAIRLADSPRGPWRKARRESPDSLWSAAGKTLFDGQRRLLIPWLGRCEGERDRGERCWGGHMLLPRELYLAPDGEPAVRCPQEILAAFSEDALGGVGMHRFVHDDHPWQITHDAVNVNVPTTGAVALWADAPVDYRFSGTIMLSGESTTAGILLRTTQQWRTGIDVGYQLLFEPDRRRISLRHLCQWDNGDVLTETTYDFTPGTPITFHLLLDGHVLELFVDDRIALVASLYDHPEGGLALLARDGTVHFSQMRILTLPDSF